MTTTSKTSRTGGTARYVVAAALVIGAFFGAYQFAQARGNAAASPTNAGAASALPGGSGAPGAGGAACACCGSTAPTAGGVTGDPVEGTASVTGGVQTVSVDLSKGYYEPNTIALKAGVPAEITFGQSSGCTGQVMSQDLNFFEDLTTGAKTVRLPALEAGEYAFSCGMQMVFGKIVVQ
jgi:hypothetical protein